MPTLLETVAIPAHPPDEYFYREQFTVAWLHVVCSPVQAQATNLAVDRAVDALVLATLDDDTTVTLAVQLKAVSPAVARDAMNAAGDQMAYSITRKQAGRLCADRATRLGLFAVIEVPDPPIDWCTRAEGPHALTLSTRSWWTLVTPSDVTLPEPLASYQSKVNNGTTDTVTLHLRDDSHLDAHSFRQIASHLGDWVTGVAA